MPTVRKVQIVKKLDLMVQDEPNINELKAEEEQLSSEHSQQQHQ